VKLPKWTGSLVAVLLIGCGADAAVPHGEAVSPPDPIPALAMVRDGDAIYVARPTALERIDVHTGERTNVAGEEWAKCPRDGKILWMSTAIDFSYPLLAIQGTTAYLVHEDCGLWSFDFATKTSRMLVDPTPDAKEALMKSGASYPDGAIWNGKDGPSWSAPFGMAIARDGDGLLACFTSFVDEPYGDSPGDGFRERIELWSVGLDGTPREQLAFISRDRALELGEEFCRVVVPDATSILVATDHALLRFDRATRALTPIATGIEYGTEGLATDDATVYFVKNNAIVSAPRGGGDVTTLVPSSGDPRETVRMVAGVDGDYLYFNDSYTLKRMRKVGGDVTEFVHGDTSDWIMPRMLGFADDFVYFERMTNDPSTGSSLDPSYLGTLFRARK
jgi:hypothetical protein